MNLNADLVARAVLRLVAENEALNIQRDALAEENDRLRQENEALKAPAGPRAVPTPEENQPA
jgi:regulator of replication initiation timing